MREPDYSILANLNCQTKPRKSLIGQPFNRWTAYGFLGYAQHGKGFWLCQCACGNWGIIRSGALQSNKSQSCGCIRKEGRRRTHGMTNTTIYSRYSDMHTRCYNKQSSPYQRYGGRGIIVEERWHSFQNFYADMGEPPTPEHSIERKNNNGNYGPDNCIWDTQTNQARNTRSNVLLTLNGETHCIAEWAEILNVPRSRIYRRHRKGLSDIECLKN